MTLHDDALPKIQNALALVESVLRGERPALRGEQDAWLLQTLERMFTQMYLFDHPSMLVEVQGYAHETIIPHADGTPAKAKVTAYVSNIYPLSELLLEQAEELRAAFGTHYPLWVCGAQIAQRRVPYQPYSLPLATACIYVASAGDVYTLRDMLEVLRALFMGQGHAHSRLIIQNNEGFWDAFLAYIQPEGCAGVYVSSYAEESLQYIQKDAVFLACENAALWDEDVGIPAGSTIFVATKTKNKLAEIATIFEGTGVRVMKLENIVNFSNPPELSGTYGGNVYEKICSAMGAVDAVMADSRAWEQAQATMRLNGVEVQARHKLFIFAEDSGLHFNDARIISHMDLRGMESGLRLNHYQSPGQEYGPSIFGKLGEEKFFEQAYEAMRVINRTHAEPPAVATITNTSVMAIAPFFANAEGERACFVFGGGVLLRLTKHPEMIRKRREKHGFSPVLTTKDYLSPQEANLYHLTISELEERFRDHPSPFNMRDLSYQAMYGHKAHAAWALMNACGLDQHHHIAPFSAVGGQKLSLKIAVFHGDLQLKVQGFQALACAVHEGNASWRTYAESITLEHDAFVFMPESISDDAQLFDTIYMLFSIIVARQLSPRDMEKPLILVNPYGEYDALLAVYHEMRQTSMLPDPDQDFIKEVQAASEVVPVLAFYAHNVWRDTQCLMDAPPLDVVLPDRFQVAVFCSASARNQSLNQVAEDLGYYLASHDYGMVYGAGDRQMMGSVLCGVLKFHDQTGQAVWVSGSSTSDIINVESDDKDALKAVIAAHGQYAHAQDIYQRMDFMIRAAHGFVILPGGAGTVQELALLLKLKQAHAPQMQGKEIIIYDPLVSKRDQQSFYGALLRMLPEALLARLGVSVCAEEKQLYAHIHRMRG